ncbi:MAG: hypothetical protein ATN31_01860 [Candidatus Epulonipiscioides saccharophilum]|nr:MAG: hypothetical protein ATN31_01860 [Epulopiscium sp. AS2M-Bin001]
MKNLQKQREELLSKISEMEQQFKGEEKILEAIKNQRWFFFRNKPKVLMDKTTGLLWANLYYFPYCKPNNKAYAFNKVVDVINKYNFNDIRGFRVPTPPELWEMIEDKTFPFKSGDKWRIRNSGFWNVNNNGSICGKCLNYEGAWAAISNTGSFILPCSSILVDNTDYVKNINASNKVYNEKERLQFTLDLFVQNDLEPIFKNDEITQLYRTLYIEKLKLLEQLSEIEKQIQESQQVNLLSADFDYKNLLSKYDATEIDNSIIQYYENVQKWVTELVEQLENYETEKSDIVNNFKDIENKLSTKYVNNKNLTEDENILLANRQVYFKNNLSLNLVATKNKLLAVKTQADNLENRIDEINNETSSIQDLALLEEEKRAGFNLIAENTAKILKTALLKIEFFEANTEFINNMVIVWEKWSSDYNVFKTAHKSSLKNMCDSDGIEDVWEKWYSDWQKLRFIIEGKIQPLVEQGLKGNLMPKNVEDMIGVLENYKKSVDKFYLEERVGIYQKFVFQSGGDLQDKLETESSIYKLTAQFQADLQNIIFSCTKSEHRVFILKWADNLFDIQIDEVLNFIADDDTIAKEILKEFSNLKQKNYELYLADAETYSKQKLAREKQYNSLIFKMRKDLSTK